MGSRFLHPVLDIILTFGEGCFNPPLLFQDEFWTNEAAPLISPRDAEPGTGTLTVVDTGNLLSILSGELVSGGVTGSMDPSIADNSSRNRTSGVGILASVNTNGRLYCGWGASQNNIPTKGAFDFTVPTNLTINANGVDNIPIATVTAQTDYQLISILRMAGSIQCIKGGTEFLNWTFLWVDNAASDASLYANYGRRTSGTATLDYLRVAQLAAPFNADAGLHTDSIANPAAGNTFTHEADFGLEFDLVTLPSSNLIYVYFRHQDASNFWYIRISSAGDLWLLEFDDGSSTIRGTALTALSGGERIRVEANGNVTTAWYDNTQAWTYTDLNNLFLTETDGIVESLGTGGDIDNLITYPMLLTDEARGSVSAGTTFTHDADGSISYVVDTLPSSGEIQLRFRQQDANNHYRLDIESDGDFELQKVESSTPDKIADAGAIINAGDFIEIVLSGSSIKVYQNGDLIMSPTESFLSDQTTGYLNTLGTGGVISHLKTKPLTDASMGIATDWLPGERTADEMFTHKADCLIEFEVTTLPSSGAINIFFRIDNIPNDYWWLYIQSDGTIILYEVVGGSSNGRGSAATVLSGGERIMIICDDEDITVYYDNTQAFTYASAASFKTKTTGSLYSLGTGGMVSDIITWPRVASDDALRQLEKYSKPCPPPVIPGPEFLFRDEFSVSRAAPLVSPRAAEPGPGSSTIVDTGNLAFIANSKFTIVGYTSSNWEPKIASPLQQRFAGVAMFDAINLASDIPRARIGWLNLELSEHDYWVVGDSVRPTTTNDIYAVLYDTDYWLVIILRSTGAFYYIKDSGNWVLLDVDDIKSTESLNAAIGSSNGVGTHYHNSFRVAQLSAPFNVDAGLYTDSIANPAASNTFTHEADMGLEFDLVTLPSSGTVYVYFRIQDSSNLWSVLITDTGSLYIYEYVDAFWTSRGGSGGVLSGGEHIRVEANGNVITSYYDNTQSLKYTDLNNYFLTETDGEVDSLGTGGDIDNLITYPMLLTDEIRGSVVQWDLATHEANGKISFVVDSLPTTAGDDIKIRYRELDGDNNGFIKIEGDGDVQAWEFIGGVNYSKDTVVGAVSDGDFIEITFSGTDVRYYVNGNEIVAYLGDASIANATIARVTSLDVGGAISHLKTKPLTDASMGMATDWLPGQRSEGEAFNHEADCLIEFVVETLPSANYFNLYIRTQDSDNNWTIRVYDVGTIRLYEKVGGVYTDRGEAATVLSGGERIVIVADDEDITVYYDNTQAFTYASASNFKTYTTGKWLFINGSIISDIITWPRVASDDALAELEKYSQPYEVPAPDPSFLFHDDFIYSKPSPLVSPRAAEPGPGQLTVVDTEEKIQITGGELNIAGGMATPAWGDPGIWSNLISFQSGIALIGNLTNMKNSMFGWDIDQSSTPGLWAFRPTGTNIVLYDDGIGTIDSIGTFSPGTDYKVVLVQNAGLFFSYIKGGAFSEWTLLYVIPQSIPASAYATFINYQSNPLPIDYIRVANFPAPFNVDAGVYTDSIADPGPTNTFVHEADFGLEFDLVTLPSSPSISVDFRWQDVDNRFAAYINNLGTFQLFEKYNTSWTKRGEASGVLSGGERIRVEVNGNVYNGYYDDTLGWTYTDLNNYFLTETDGEVTTIPAGGDIDNLITYPMLLTDEIRGSITPVDYFTHKDDCRISLVVDTVPSADKIIFTFRKQSGSERLQCEITSAGAFQILQYYQSVWTYPISEAGAGVTDGDFIEIVLSGSSMSAYINGDLLASGTVDLLTLIGIPDFTTVGTGGAISHLKTKPLTDPSMGIATDWLPGQRSAGEAFNHEADCLIEFEITTLTTGGNTNILFRYQDATHYWMFEVNSSGDIRLKENDGGFTTRGSALAALSGGERIVIVCDDEDITVYYDNTQAFTYASAASFKTKTTGDILSLGTGKVSDIITWPRVASDDALEQLEKYSQPHIP